jgi:hypothetical protein
MSEGIARYFSVVRYLRTQPVAITESNEAA